MKLYHGTSKEAAQSIIENGFEFSSECNARLGNSRDVDGNLEVIYGAATYDLAEDFAIDQCFDDGFEVIEFEIDDNDAMADPEYDEGDAYWTTETPANVKICTI